MGLVILMSFFIFWFWGMEKVFVLFGVGFVVWVMVGVILEIVIRVKFFEIGLKCGF